MFDSGKAGLSRAVTGLQVAVNGINLFNGYTLGIRKHLALYSASISDKCRHVLDCSGNKCLQERCPPTYKTLN